MGGGALFDMMFTIVPIFIAVVGVITVVGAIMTFAGVLRHRKMFDRVADEAFSRHTARPTGSHSESAKPAPAPGSFHCTHCGASLGTDTEISPSGDFKCEYCDSWSNVNR